MLRIRVCATRMGWFLGQTSLDKGPFSADFPLPEALVPRVILHKHGWVIQKLAKNSQKWVVFPQNSS